MKKKGPEFGGSIGILFYAAYCVGVAFYCTGFAEELVATWIGDPDDYHWATVGVASAILFVALIVALGGAGWFTKINVFLFVIQMAAIIISMLAMFARPTFQLDDNSCVATFGNECTHQSWSWSIFKDNWASNCVSNPGLDCISFQGFKKMYFCCLCALCLCVFCWPKKKNGLFVFVLLKRL